MKSRARLARVHVVADGGSLISSAGGALLTETARLTGLNRRLSHGLRRWRGLGAVHDPGKIVQDLASAIALGGDCLADIAVVRAQSELFGSVASDPTVSRLMRAAGASTAARPLTGVWFVGIGVDGMALADALGRPGVRAVGHTVRSRPRPTE